MIRRSFFQSLAAALLPPLAPADANPVPPACHPSSPLSSDAPPVSPPGWLTDWRKIPRLEVFPEDFPDLVHPLDWALAGLVLRHIASGVPLTFRYAGGSEPGSIRTVLPTLLFWADDYAYDRTHPEDPGLPPEFRTLYLLAWCKSRHASRTFRLDRMEMPEPAAVRSTSRTPGA